MTTYEERTYGLPAVYPYATSFRGIPVQGRRFDGDRWSEALAGGRVLRAELAAGRYGLTDAPTLAALASNHRSLVLDTARAAS